MPNKLADEIRSLTDQQLHEQFEQARRDLFNLRFRNATRQLENNQEIRKVKHRIARLKTIESERRLGLQR